MLATTHGATLTGIHSSEEMLAAARAVLDSDRVDLRSGEGRTLPTGPFDLVV